MKLLYLAVVLSGAASLLYQVAWTRAITSVTSATVAAQAITLSVFMAGLGLGSFWAARRCSSARRPILYYASLEAIAALFALPSVRLIQESHVIRTQLFEWGVSLSAGLWLQLTFLVVYLLLPSMALGASLPFVIEHWDQQSEDRSAKSRGRAVGWLYGFNTLGATAGALVGGLLFIELWGLFKTALGGVFLAFSAVGIAALVGRMSKQAPDRSDIQSTQADTTLPSTIVIAVTMAGFVGLAQEVVFTRLISLVVLNTVYAFSQVLAAVLVGIALGSYLASAIARRHDTDEAITHRALQMAALALILAGLFIAAAPHLLMWFAEDAEAEAILATGLSLKGALLLLTVVTPPATLVASTLPLVVTALTRMRAASGFGFLYAVNTAGSVLGSLAAGFVLLPYLGTGGAVLATSLLAIGAAVILGFGRNQRTGLIGLLAAVLSVLLFFSLRLPHDLYHMRMRPNTKLLAIHEGTSSDVAITENDKGHRRIWINSAWVAGTGGGHRVLGHLPALFVDKPKRGLGIALGTGQTFAALAKHGIDKLDCVEINPGVIKLSKEWFKEANGGLFTRPGVVLHQNDGRAYMRATQARYDLIVLEPLQAWSAGTSNLYSKEFYEEAQRLLNPGGVVAQWIPFYGQSVRDTKSMVKTALGVFDQASLWIDLFDGILILHDGEFRLQPNLLSQRIHRRGLEGELSRNAVNAPRDLLSMFLLGPRGVKAWSRDAPILSDDHPFLEFSAARFVGKNHYQLILESTGPYQDDPAIYAPSASKEERQDLAEAAIIRSAMLAAGPAQHKNEHANRAHSLEKALLEIPHSRLLETQYRDAVLAWAGAPSMPAKQREKIYRTVLNAHPGLGEIAVNLGILYAKAGQPEKAKAAFVQAHAVKRTARIADRLLQMLSVQFPGSARKPAHP